MMSARACTERGKLARIVVVCDRTSLLEQLVLGLVTDLVESQRAILVELVAKTGEIERQSRFSTLKVAILSDMGQLCPGRRPDDKPPRLSVGMAERFRS